MLNATGITLPTFSAWSAPVAVDDRLGHRRRGRGQGRAEGRPGYTKGSQRLLPEGRQDRLDHADQPVRVHRLRARSTSIVAQELKSAGIDATFQGISVNAWNADIATGNFTLTEHWSNGGLTPYNLYDNWLDSALASRTAATGDYERLKNPAIDAALAKLAGDSTVAQQTAALAPIAKYVAANLPVIPITTASDWFEYNSQHFVGWPTQPNPYETGQPSGTNNSAGTGTDEVVILHLRPRS